METFWKRVLSFKKRGEVAKTLETSPSTVTTWIKFDRLPRVDDAVDIARACKTSVEFLVTGEKEPEAIKLYRDDSKFRQFMDEMAEMERGDWLQCIGALQHFVMMKLHPEKKDFS